MTKIGSDGGPSEYYDFPEGATTLNDLIEFRRMDFAQGNIFKAAFRMGCKDGISLEYDLRKIIYYAQRKLAQIEKDKTNGTRETDSNDETDDGRQHELFRVGDIYCQSVEPTKPITFSDVKPPVKISDH